MTTRTLRLGFLIAVLVLGNVTEPQNRGVVRAATGTCFCGLPPYNTQTNAYAYRYDPMYQFVDQQTFATYTSVPDGDFYSQASACQSWCFGQGHSAGHSLCNANGLNNGVGFFELGGRWDFQTDCCSTYGSLVETLHDCDAP